MKKAKHDVLKALSGIIEDRRSEPWIQFLCEKARGWVLVDRVQACKVLSGTIETISQGENLGYISGEVKASIIGAIAKFILAVERENMREKYPHNN